MRDDPWKKADEFSKAEQEEHRLFSELALIRAEQIAQREMLIQFICDQQGKSVGEETEKLQKRTEALAKELTPPKPGLM